MRTLIALVMLGAISTASATELSYATVAATPCAKYTAIEGTELYGSPSEAITDHVSSVMPRQSKDMSACNINDTIMAICPAHPAMKVGDAVAYFARGRNIPAVGRCGA